MTPFLKRFLVDNENNYKLIFNPNWFNGFGSKIHQTQADLRLDYEFQSGYKLTSLTAYHDRKYMQRFDIDNRAGYDLPNPLYPDNPNTLPYLAFDNQTQGLRTDHSQEFRLTSPVDGRFDWNLGVSHLYESPRSGLISHNATGPTNFTRISDINTRTSAIFGGAHFAFLPNFTLTVEGRYQWDDLYVHPLYVRDTLLVGIDGEPLQETFTNFSPRISVDYQYSPNTMAYVLYSRGYKPGGFNTAVRTNTPAQNEYIESQGGNGAPTYDQERLDNYEFGIKTTFLDDRARVAVSFYHDKWLDGQVANVISVPANPDLPIGNGNTTGIQAPITNSGLIILQGIEFQGEVQATSHLHFNATFALNDTDVRHYETCSDCVQILGTTAADGEVPNAPKWTAAAGATYTNHLVGDWNWTGRIDYNYLGKQFIDYTNMAWTHSANLFNVHVGAQNDKYQVTAFVKNLTDNSTPPSVTRITNGFYQFFPPRQHSIDYTLPEKRTVGVRFNYRF
jgi:outer membrane receptor protein involved in Fe transport